jgi:hypothetical protein
MTSARGTISAGVIYLMYLWCDGIEEFLKSIKGGVEMLKMETDRCA